MKIFHLIIATFLFVGNTYAEFVYLNCDYSVSSKDWQKKNNEYIDKKFYVVTIREELWRDSIFGPINLDRGLYEIFNGDLILRSERQEITYNHIYFRDSGDKKIERSSLNITAADNDEMIFGKCDTRRHNQWQKDVVKYMDEKMKDNVF